MSKPLKNSASTTAYPAYFHDDVNIPRRSQDGYFFAPRMCDAGGMRMTNYLRNHTCRKHHRELARSTGHRVDTLIQKDPTGTWMHPEVAIHFASWMNADFGNKVTAWVAADTGDRPIIAHNERIAPRVNRSQTESEPSVYRLPFVKTEMEGVHFTNFNLWQVEPSGNFSTDMKTGKLYADACAHHFKTTGDNLFSLIFAEIQSECTEHTGIEIGFLDQMSAIPRRL